MSSHLGAEKRLELLDRLSGTVRDFAARADKLNGDFRAGIARERQRREAAAEEQDRQLAAGMAEADAVFQAARTAAESKDEHRKTRIGRAYQASKEQGLQKVENQTGARKYDLQKKILQAERDQKTGLAAAAATFEEFRGNWPGNRRRWRCWKQPRAPLSEDTENCFASWPLPAKRPRGSGRG